MSGGYLSGGYLSGGICPRIKTALSPVAHLVITGSGRDGRPAS